MGRLILAPEMDLDKFGYFKEAALEENQGINNLVVSALRNILETQPPTEQSYGYMPGQYGPQNKISKAIVETAKQIPPLDLIGGALKYVIHSRLGNPRQEAAVAAGAERTAQLESKQKALSSALNYLGDIERGKASAQAANDMLKLYLQQMKDEAATNRLLLAEEGKNKREMEGLSTQRSIAGENIVKEYLKAWPLMSPRQRKYVVPEIQQYYPDFVPDPRDLDERSALEKILDFAKSAGGSLVEEAKDLGGKAIETGKRKISEAKKQPKTAPTEKRKRKSLDEIFSLE